MRAFLDLNAEEILAWLKENNEKSFRLKQINEWIFKHGELDFNKMTNLPVRLREKLKEDFLLPSLKIIHSKKSRDGQSIKYLIKLKDNLGIEAVLLKYRYGNTVCLSTQVGCKMGCKFCATGLGGFSRNLTAGEMIEQILVLQGSSSEKITRVVLMGSGEPLDNFTEVLKFLRKINEKDCFNISYRKITVSTCGMVPQIKALAEEKLPVTLAISLHAPDDALRNELIPINKRWSIAELLDAAWYFIDKTGRRVTFEYALIEDVNDTVEHALKLAHLLQRKLVHVNLIPYNTIEKRNFKTPSLEKINKFKEVLKKAGIPVTVRRELGDEIDGACGQLKAKYFEV
ncbi:23S rRNA (adenine(2503)-C(2))-methyltransferase RlmN [Carboxydothermus islandicus]|uniref:Probable dual-specificity RNA methyltransferase RlmN n=1 Tax=Carboxydothermus islandicus TaxID=661089 RepID=A0A1L8D1H1_9THEO|nr:23S rRNA (adenine(2503)-C(2))-methyltransferase RlmN [Carboxydothermus islandicus]GAV25022.1 23S rRNA (adenine(2503)-C(2))-methyltransferase RlmN [Carboxydothermus islandicus]